MIQIHIPEVVDFWDSVHEEFVNVKAYDLWLEHSLLSVAEWEARWHKPFLSKNEKTNEELIDYIRCMVRKRNVDEIDPRTFLFIPESEMKRIQEYIEDDHTATSFRENPWEKKQVGRQKEKVLTSEVIYYYMIALNIPMECQKWHLGRLQTLIKVCNEMNKEMDPKYKDRKLTVKEQSDMAKSYHELNAKRRAALGTKG